MITTKLKKVIENRRGSRNRVDIALVRIKDSLWLFSHKTLPWMSDQAARVMLPFCGKKLLQQLTPFAVTGFQDKIRLGNPSDGGYVIPKDILPLIQSVYTYGVENDVSFEEDLIKMASVPVRLYDHTIDALPVNNKNFFFKKQGIARNKHGAFDTFRNHVIENGDTDKRILLKIDIEGHEWDVISDIIDTEYKNIVAIILEMHGFDRYAYTRKYIRVLKKINSRFTLVHIHGNNTCGVIKVSGKKIPILCELTLINNRLVSERKALNEQLPSRVDRPNQPHLEDIVLDFWKK